MAEYGQGVGQGTGASGGGGGSTDLTGSAAAFISDAVDQVAALPAEMLVLIVILVLAGLLVVKRAF
jgi:hypothetical protein